MQHVVERSVLRGVRSAGADCSAITYQSLEPRKDFRHFSNAAGISRTLHVVERSRGFWLGRGLVSENWIPPELDLESLTINLTMNITV